LKSLRQERFAQELAKGKSAREAYELAGYRPHKAHGNRLRNQPYIQKRYNELIAASVQRTEVTAAGIITELAKIAFANLGDYMKVGPAGQPHLDFSALTREQAAALTEVTVDELKAARGADGREIRRVRFKLGDKRAALADLAKMLGLFRDRVEVTDTTPVEARQPPSDFEVARRIAFLLAKAATEQQASTPIPPSS
jgi:phage terminase small subunit